jgi:hypothetical protein
VPDNDFDLADPATWPDDSYAGRERDFADLLDDDTMASLGFAYELVTDADGADFTQASYAVFHLMLGHEAAFLAMTGAAGIGPVDSRWASRMALRSTIQYIDANDSSGMYFEIRLRQRLEEGG